MFETLLPLLKNDTKINMRPLYLFYENCFVVQKNS